MCSRQREPTAIVELANIAEGDAESRFATEHVHIGALVTHRELAERAQIGREMSWLRTAAAALGDVQMRNLGTGLDNICWADPRANSAIAMPEAAKG
jgi:CO/xanthine dehydrogenase FAD-binding subunit